MSGPRSRAPAPPPGVPDDRGEIAPNVVALPRRLRDFPTWAALVASYAARPSAPAEVLPFVRPGSPPPPGRPPFPAKPRPGSPRRPHIV